MSARPPVRIALNVAIDAALAALAVPLARAVADPSGDWLHPPWLPAAGAATLLLAGLPFRLPWQFWRFAGIDELLAVAWSSVVGAALLAFVLALTGAASGNPAFPVVYALTLLVLLGAPRVAYRRWRHRRGGTLPSGFAPDMPSALVVGATEDIDLFLRALAWDRRQSPAGRGIAGSRCAPDRATHPRLPVPRLDRGCRRGAGTSGGRGQAAGHAGGDHARPCRANRSPSWWSRRRRMACASAARRARRHWMRPGRRIARASWSCGRWRSRTC